MARFQRGMAKRPIHSIKHVVDIQGGLTVGTQAANFLVDTKDAPVLANEAEVITGSTVNAIYLNVQAYATSTAALANLYMIIMKNPGDNVTVPAANQVGSSDAKKFIIHQEMVMLENNATGMPRIMFKGVLMIPRGYRRFGPDDSLTIALLSPGVTVDFCVQCIYKEYR